MSDRDFPWQYCLQLSVSKLGITQETFWEMTPRQWLLQCAAHNLIPAEQHGNLRDMLKQAMHKLPD